MKTENERINMKVIVTGSSGHLGEALVKNFRKMHHDVVGIDVLPADETTVVGSITDKELVEKAVEGADVVVHTATLHKPHINSHTKQQFIDVNVRGTQNLLDSAVTNNVKAFVFTSTTSTFGHAMDPTNGKFAVWVTEELRPVPKNIYGVTKAAAEDLCQIAHQDHGLNCLVLKTSRFFPEDDDMKHTMAEYSQDNLKAIEFLYRRADIADIVAAHNLAIERAAEIGFDKLIITATTPFEKADCEMLATDAPAVVQKYHPEFSEIFRRQGWKMLPTLGRVYDNGKARERLGWEPKWNFGKVIQRVNDGEPLLGPTAVDAGEKGYHRQLDTP